MSFQIRSCARYIESKDEEYAIFNVKTCIVIDYVVFYRISDIIEHKCIKPGRTKNPVNRWTVDELINNEDPVKKSKRKSL